MCAVGAELCLSCWLFQYQNLQYATVNLQAACSQFYLRNRDLELVGSWRYFFALMLRLITGRMVCTKCLSMCTVKVTQENAAQVRIEMNNLFRMQ